MEGKKKKVINNTHTMNHNCKQLKNMFLLPIEERPYIDFYRDTYTLCNLISSLVN